MKTDTPSQNEMTIDDGDNLVSDAWSNMVQDSPALRRALDEQADRWLIENGARIGVVLSQQTPRPDTSGFASMLG